MSNQQSSSSFTSYSSVSYSSSSSSQNGEQVSGTRYTSTTQSDPSGTTVTSSRQNLGEPAVEERRQFDSQGRELLEGSGGQRRIEDVDEAQAERDRLYEERIEEEYAKREGGA